MKRRPDLIVVLAVMFVLGMAAANFSHAVLPFDKDKPTAQQRLDSRPTV